MANRKSNKKQHQDAQEEHDNQAPVSQEPVIETETSPEPEQPAPVEVAEEVVVETTASEQPSEAAASPVKVEEKPHSPAKRVSVQLDEHPTKVASPTVSAITSVEASEDGDASSRVEPAHTIVEATPTRTTTVEKPCNDVKALLARLFEIAVVVRAVAISAAVWAAIAVLFVIQAAEKKFPAKVAIVREQVEQGRVRLSAEVDKRSATVEKVGCFASLAVAQLRTLDNTYVSGQVEVEGRRFADDLVTEFRKSHAAFQRDGRF